ncbi:hypothetical protein PTKIN_Ptkin08bG0080200 [Pterospermum kingtungense]
MSCDSKSEDIATFLWKKDMLNIKKFSNNFIYADVSKGNRSSWRITGYYGFPKRSKRCDFWNLLRTLHAYSNLPWCCIEDFNDMLMTDDKKRQVKHPTWLYSGFRNVVSKCDLHDIQL